MVGDFAVGKAVGDEVEDFDFAFAQGFDHFEGRLLPFRGRFGCSDGLNVREGGQ